ncbi:MAG TPA: KUP/HAK/KT family potassium transporter [Geodermatophilus sp.]|nr:KUP/HAK/KT family potassium transporter [Geodermatophilus sp.]
MGGPALVLGALGVVYGDIGTSPLYAVDAVFATGGGVARAAPGEVVGIASLVFWALTITVSVKYVLFVLRADNDGEGGVIALAALVQRSVGPGAPRTAGAALVLGVLGASLFYGDSVITPAISVLSAVEGLRVVSPGLSGAVLPLAVLVVSALFAVQRWGTGAVGRVFGPVMLLWFAALGSAGLAAVWGRPGVLRGLSPTYGLQALADRPAAAFVLVGAVVLAVTGAEALYADMGQFGRGPVRRAWFLFVFPALTLNYLGQAAVMTRRPGAAENPFFLLYPSWAQLPVVVLATAATVIASQAVIAGAFSLSHQAMQLGLVPRLRIRHTSRREAGQVYVPAVNRALFVAVLGVMLAFGSSERLAGAYGVAVTATFLITTVLLLVVARVRWAWSWYRVVPLGCLLGVVESTYLAATLTKVPHGGWLTLLIAAVLFTCMTTWRRGSRLVAARRTEREGTLGDVVAELGSHGVPRVPGIAVYPHLAEGTAPLALRATLERFHVAHRRIVVITGRTASVPHVPWAQRLAVEHLGHGVLHVTADFGFRDPLDFPAVLRRALPGSRPSHPDHPDGAPDGAPDGDPDTATWFLTRLALHRTRGPGPGAWRTRLFTALVSGAGGRSRFLHLPPDRTVTMGVGIDI